MNRSWAFPLLALCVFISTTVMWKLKGANFADFSSEPESSTVATNQNFILSEHHLDQKPQYGCILYLMTDVRYTDEIRSSMLLVDHFFNKKDVPVENGPNMKPYDYIVFHTPDIKQEHKDIMQTATKVPIKFVTWEMNFPKFIQDRLDVVGMKKSVWTKDHGRLSRWLHEHQLHGGTCVNWEWPIGYMMMNRFFSFQMYQQPILKNYKYYLRIDADSFPSNYWKKDPFLEMDKQNATFLWRDVYGPNPQDPESCVRNMKKYSVEYFQKMFDTKSLPPNFWDKTMLGEVDEPAVVSAKGLETVKNLPEGYKWEGNFGAGRLGFFRSSNYLGLARTLNDEHDGIYRNRWGDQAMYPLGLFAYDHTIVKGWGDAELSMWHKQIPPCEYEACKKALEKPWKDIQEGKNKN